MTPEELTQLASVHQTILTRHDVEMAEIRAVLASVAQQQEATAHQAALNQEAIANLTAGLLELRNLVADYIQGRSQTWESKSFSGNSNKSPFIL